MKKIILILIMLSSAAQAKIISTHTLNLNDEVDRVFPVKTTGLKDNCGYELFADIRAGANKNRICRKLGYKSYVPNSLTINHQATLMLGTLIESVSFCVGAPVGRSKGIRSIECYK